MSAPIFQHVPEDGRERWRQLRQLVGRVYGADMPEKSRLPRVPSQLKSRLNGKPLPPSMRQWMAFGRDFAKCCQQVGDSLFPYTYQIADFPKADAILLNKYYDCMRWCVAYRDLDREDPPVNTFAFAPKLNQWVLRKSYRRLPVTELALHCVLKHTPWLHGWKGYAWRSADVADAAAYLDQLRASKGAHVSDPPFGCVTIVEGDGWWAYVVDGYTHFGPDRFVRLYTSKRARLREIPSPIRDTFELTKQSQLGP